MTKKKMPDHCDLLPNERDREFSHETAGSRMTRKVPTVYEDQKIGDIQSLILHCIHVFRSIDYVYVLDRDGRFVGVMSMKDLYGAGKALKVGKVCKKDSLVSVHPDASQERVVYLALKHNIKAVPVVDEHRLFLGAVLNDTILTILYKEAHEDLLHMAGITHPHAVHSNVLDTPLLTSMFHRLPWLLVGMIGGVLSAKVIGLFENTLQQNLILATFIPLIVYMSDAVGTQMEAYMIRDLARDNELPFVRYFLRQLAIVVLMALLLGGALFVVGSLLYGESSLAATLGISLAAAIASSVCTGLLVPYAFSRMKMDPADASGPIATIMQDLLSVVIYFSVATWLL